MGVGAGTGLSASRLKNNKKIVLNVHRKHRAYQGRGEGGGKV